MKIRLDIQFIYFGREYGPGDEIEMPDNEARRFIERGYAIECMAMTPPEKAIEPIARKRHARIKTARTNA
jgi:hypothetical protein